MKRKKLKMLEMAQNKKHPDDEQRIRRDQMLVLYVCANHRKVCRPYTNPIQVDLLIRTESHFPAVFAARISGVFVVF